MWTWTALMLLLTVAMLIVAGSYIEPMEPMAVLEGKPFNVTCVANVTGKDGPCELQRRLPNGTWCNLYTDSEESILSVFSQVQKIYPCGMDGRFEVTDLGTDSFTVTITQARLTDGTMYRCRLFSEPGINSNTSLVVIQTPTIDTSRWYILNSIGEMVCSVMFMMPEDTDSTRQPSLRLTLNGRPQNGEFSQPEFGQKLMVVRRKFDRETDNAKLICSAIITDPVFMINVTQHLEVFDLPLVVGLSVGVGVLITVVVAVIIECRFKCIRNGCQGSTHSAVRKQDDSDKHKRRKRTQNNRKPPTFTQKEVEKIIKKYLPDLYRRLAINDELIAKLHREDVIDDPTYSMLEQNESEKQRIGVIMKSIRRKGVPAFVNFCIVLVDEDTAQSHIVTDVMKLDVHKMRQRKEKLLLEEGTSV